MKVLRTALFSAFLTICLVHIGNAQTIQIKDMYALSFGSSVSVGYEIIAPKNSIAKITLGAGALPTLSVLNTTLTDPIESYNDGTALFHIYGYIQNVPQNYLKIISTCNVCPPNQNQGCKADSCIVVGGKGQLATGSGGQSMN